MSLSHKKIGFEIIFQKYKTVVSVSSKFQIKLKLFLNLIKRSDKLLNNPVNQRIVGDYLFLCLSISLKLYCTANLVCGFSVQKARAGAVRPPQKLAPKRPWDCRLSRWGTRPKWVIKSYQLSIVVKQKTHQRNTLTAFRAWLKMPTN